MSTTATRHPAHSAYSWAAAHRVLSVLLTLTVALAIVVTVALVTSTPEGSTSTGAVETPSNGSVLPPEHCAGHRCAR